MDEVKKTEKEITAPTGITPEQAKATEAQMRYEEEIRDRIRHERKLTTDRADIMAESESLNIPINLPENPTELQLAKARLDLGMKKKEVKPSPETVAIEAGKRGYYIFTNREQDDASHTVDLGGKYTIHLVPDKIHVLSDYHIKRWNECAIVPQYETVSTGVKPGPETVARLTEKSVRVGGRRRFTFEFIGLAPKEAEFGLVTDEKILKELAIS